MTLTPEEFASWLQDPVTQAVRECLRKQRRDIMERWAAGRFTHENAGASAQSSAEAIGECKALLWAAELDFETYESEMTDGEYKRNTPPGGGSADQDA